MMDFDEGSEAAFSLFWGRRYDTFADSALHYSPTDLGEEFEEEDSEVEDGSASPVLANRPPTPNPVTAGRHSPSPITPEQRSYWGNTVEMQTVVDNVLHRNLVNSHDLEMMEQDEMVEPEEDEIKAVHLGDSLSPGNRKKIDHILEGLYQPASPEPVARGKNWERIIPKTEKEDEAGPSNVLSKVTVRLATKRANTTPVEELEAREMMEISDSTIREGDDAAQGLNVLDMDGDLLNTLTEADMTNIPQSRPTPAPRASTSAPAPAPALAQGTTSPLTRRSPAPNTPTASRSQTNLPAQPLPPSARPPPLETKRSRMMRK